MDFITGASDDIFTTISGAQSARESVAISALTRGAKYYQDGDNARAAIEFRRAGAFKPDYLEAHYYLAKAHVRGGRPDEAITAYRKAVEIQAKTDPTSTQVRAELAQYLVTLGRYADAEKEYNTITRLSPGSAGPAASLGHIYLTTGRSALAELQFRRVVALAPADPAAHYSLGLVYNEQERYSEAVSEFSTALRLRPDYAMARADLAYSYIGLGRSEEAQNQVAELNAIGTDEALALAQEVEMALLTPKILYADPFASTFDTDMGPRTELSQLDASLAEPGAVKTFSLALAFSQPMDRGSVENVFNWMITRSTGGRGGLYNNGMSSNGTREAAILPIPSAVHYDPETYRVTIDFRIVQNAEGNALIDPSHIVFRFKGTSFDGSRMDPDADQYDGARGAF